MADQKKITLRPLHSTPKNVVLRDLPVVTLNPGTTIYLYENHALPKNIVLRNPKVAELSDGAVTGTLAATLSALTGIAAGDHGVSSSAIAELTSLVASLVGEFEEIGGDVVGTIAGNLSSLQAGFAGNLDIPAPQVYGGHGFTMRTKSPTPDMRPRVISLRVSARLPRLESCLIGEVLHSSILDDNEFWLMAA